MAIRPVFAPDPFERKLVKAVDVSFVWNSGFSVSQKRKNIKNMHIQARRLGLEPLLEISTKSEERLGVRLSSFNLTITTSEFGDIPLECAFQGSKVFKNGGPFIELYRLSPKDAKRDTRLRESGSLIAFEFEGEKWPIEPKTVFYDWLYVRSVYPRLNQVSNLRNYAGFTDIEFNPNRSYNCQAKSCALLVSLMVLDKLDAAMRCRDEFMAIAKGSQNGENP